MKLEEIARQALEFSQTLEDFLRKNKLEDLIEHPVDHAAVKLANTSEYDDFINYVLPLCESAEEIQMNSRRITSAKLKKPLLVGSFGETQWLEITEPRPEKVGKDIVGFEHIEVVVSDVSALEAKVLREKIPHEKNESKYHTAIVFRIDMMGHEIKFSNKPHEKILEAERNDGLLKSLK